MQPLADIIERTRHSTDKTLEQSKRSELGQFMTNWKIAKFMASLFDMQACFNKQRLHILDPGAGIGSLSSALTEQLIQSNFPGTEIHTDAYEIDPKMRLGLDVMRREISRRTGSSLNIVSGDFIEEAVEILCPKLSIEAQSRNAYDLSILNPPYKKVSSSSKHRRLLSSVGIETSNLYTAFFGLSILLLAPGGQICAIIPRSFGNGTYFRSFRQFLYTNIDIEHIHIFDSRKDAFSHNDVLQENIIVHARKKGGALGSSIIVSRSQNDSFSDMSKLSIKTTDVWGERPDRFIYIPATDKDLQTFSRIKTLPCTLKDLLLSVSTGPVVQFRLRTSLSFMAGAPMIYCASMRKGIARQKTKSDKLPGFIEVNHISKKWLVPNSTYLLIRRFSSKEEKRRIVCAIYQPQDGQNELLGIDNKINFIHKGMNGLPINIAYGLFVYLSSTLLDQYYRLVSGHTQVNSGDLRNLRFPSYDLIEEVGNSFMSQPTDDQSTIDSFAESYFL